MNAALPLACLLVCLSAASLQGLYPVSALLALPHSLPSRVPARLLRPAVRLPLLTLEREEEACSGATSSCCGSSGVDAGREGGDEGGEPRKGTCENGTNNSCRLSGISVDGEGIERDPSGVSLASAVCSDVDGDGGGAGEECREDGRRCTSGALQCGRRATEGQMVTQHVVVPCKRRLHLALSLGYVWSWQPLAAL